MMLLGQSLFSLLRPFHLSNNNDKNRQHLPGVLGGGGGDVSVTNIATNNDDTDSISHTDMAVTVSALIGCCFLYGVSIR